MKGFKKYLFSLFLLSVFFSACEKYNYTPLYPPPPAGYYDYVTIGTVYNGNLIVAGNFSALFGSANNIAQWNGSSWQPMGAGISQGVTAFATYNGNLIAGGSFITAGGQPTSLIAQWNGSSWQTFSNLTVNLYSVNALTVYNGNLVVGGVFQYDGGSISNLVEWNGSSWQTTLGGAYNYNIYNGDEGSINALTVYNGNLIAGGNFDSIGTQHILGLAQWNGTTWSTVGGVCNGVVNALVVFNGNLIATGTFTKIGGVSANGSAQWNGTTWSALNSVHSDYYNNTSISFVNYNGSLYYASQYVNDSTLYQWNISGSPAVIGNCTSIKETWYSQDGIKATMYPLCVYNGNLVVGGWFTSVNGVSCNYNLAQWNGTNWSSF